MCQLFMIIYLPMYHVHFFTPLCITYRDIEREVCKDVKMRAFTEKCEEEPVLRPYVDCGTQMMPLSLKDICVKIDFQLPRQDCKLEKRKECR